jgi:acetyl-CoA carboxylase carboxyl transferase subunit beta
MNWLNNIARPKIKSLFSRKESPDNLWHKCKQCGEMIFHRDIEAKLYVCPACDYHMKIKPEQRLKSLFDGEYEVLELPTAVIDPLKFRDQKRYTDRLKEAKNKTNQEDSITVAFGKMSGEPTVIVIQNFEFMGGSLGMAAGEAIIEAATQAVARRAPLIMFAASGGARMQEGILSLMQLPRTTIAVQMVKEAGLPYVVVLTDPTSGGVTASYGMLGDIHIAEPGALIAFTGPRVIEQTIREKLPDGFQRAEYLLEHGMVDMVVHRHNLRETLARIVSLLMSTPRQRPTALEESKQEVLPPAETASPPAAAE